MKTDTEKEAKKRIVILPTSLEKQLNVEILDLFQKFAEKIDKNVEFFVFNKNDCGVSVEKKEDTILFIIPSFHTRTYGEPKIGILSSSYDSKTMKQDNFNIFKSEGVGRDLALITKQKVVFLSDFLLDDEVPLKKKVELLYEFLTYFSKDYKTFHETIDFRDKILENYLFYLKRLKETHKNSLKNKVRSLKDDIYNHYSAIQKQEDEMRKTLTFINSLEQKYSKSFFESQSEIAKKSMKNLFGTEKYLDIIFLQDRIIGYTNEISVISHKKKYTIGLFEVIVNLDGTIILRNKTNKKGEYDHPHIHEGNACFGNIKELIQNMILDFNFLPLFDLLLTFLKTYTYDETYGPFVQVEEHWGKEEDFCQACGKASAICSCDEDDKICPSCEENLDNCECERCPSSNALMDSVDCNNCLSLGENGTCQY